MNDLFFELIRVSIGTQSSLSHIPNVQEWDKLYRMAVKQSLIGICFNGLHNLGADANAGYVKIGMTEMQYFEWLGMACRIQEKNETVNKLCVIIHDMLSKDGYRSCILKGQSVASLYGPWAGLRQSGDIDVWMMSSPKESIEWARKTGTMYFYDYHHADLSLFPDTEVELHYRPSLSRNLIRNSRLQRWFKEEGSRHVEFKGNLGFSVPDYTFNVILTLNHNFWHLMYEGVGMRHFMDLYFVLKSRKENSSTHTWQSENKSLQTLLRHLKLQRFASASMWIMSEIFGLESKYLLCEPDEYAGNFLLDEIMQAGNFGKYDRRLTKGRYEVSRMKLMSVWMKHNLRLIKYYKSDVLWTPLGILRISLWRRWHYRNEKKLMNY